MFQRYTASSPEGVVASIIGSIPFNPFARRDLREQPVDIDLTELISRIKGLREERRGHDRFSAQLGELEELIRKSAGVFKEVFSQIPESDFMSRLTISRRRRKLFFRRGCNDSASLSDLAELVYTQTNQSLICLAYFYPRYDQTWNETKAARKRRIDLLSFYLEVIKGAFEGTEDKSISITMLDDFQLLLREDLESLSLLVSTDLRALEKLQRQEGSKVSEGKIEHATKRPRRPLTLESQITQMPNPRFVDLHLQARKPELYNCTYFLDYGFLTPSGVVNHAGKTLKLCGPDLSASEGIAELHRKPIDYQIIERSVHIDDLPKDIMGVVRIDSDQPASHCFYLPCPFGYEVKGVSSVGQLFRLSSFGGYVFYPEDPVIGITYTLVKEVTNPELHVGHPYVSKREIIAQTEVKGLEDLQRLCTFVRSSGGVYCMMPWFKSLMTACAHRGVIASDALMIFSCYEAAQYLSALLNSKGIPNIIGIGYRAFNGQLAVGYGHAELITCADDQIITLSAADITLEGERIITESVDATCLNELIQSIPQLDDEELYHTLRKFRESLETGEDSKQLRLEEKYAPSSHESPQPNRGVAPIGRSDQLAKLRGEEYHARWMIETCQQAVLAYYKNKTVENATVCLNTLIKAMFKPRVAKFSTPLTFGPPGKQVTSDSIFDFETVALEIISDLSESGLLGEKLARMLEQNCLDELNGLAILSRLRPEDLRQLELKAKYIYWCLRDLKIEFESSVNGYRLTENAERFIYLMLVLSEHLASNVKLSQLTGNTYSPFFVPVFKTTAWNINHITLLLMSHATRDYATNVLQVLASLLRAMQPDDAYEFLTQGLVASYISPFLSIFLRHIHGTPLEPFVFERDGDQCKLSNKFSRALQIQVLSSFFSDPFLAANLQAAGLNVDSFSEKILNSARVFCELDPYIALALKEALKNHSLDKQTEGIIRILGPHATVSSTCAAPLRCGLCLANFLNQIPKEHKRDFIEFLEQQSSTVEPSHLAEVPLELQELLGTDASENFDGFIDRLLEAPSTGASNTHTKVAARLGFQPRQSPQRTSLPPHLATNSLLSPVIPVEKILKSGFFNGFQLRRKNFSHMSEPTTPFIVVHGENDDFDIRDYVPGVPAKQINWRASARSQKLKANYGFGGQQSTPLVEVDMDELIKRVQTYNLPGTIDLIFEVGKQLALRASHSGIRVILKSSHGHAHIYMSAKDLDINSRSVTELANAIWEFINCAVNLPLVAGYRAYFSGRGES